MSIDIARTERLGMTNLEVSPVAFGAWQLGVNLFDTTQGYGFGASERVLSRALRDALDKRRDELVIATKGGLRVTDDGLVRDSSPDWLRRGVDESLKNLGVEHIDVYQVHWPDANVPFPETAGALEELVEAGKIRHVGVSNFDAAQMAEFAGTAQVETLQLPYDLPYCAEHDIGVLVYGPLAHGLLTGALDESTEFAPGDWRAGAPFFQGEGFRHNLRVVRELERFASEELGVSVSRLAVAWVLANPAVQVAIVGARSPRHIDDSVAAAALDLGQAELDQIDQIVSRAAPMTGPRPEMMPE
jgi:aryl-alcohol dehydrogenase-like predicted oxidoreductase